MSGEDIRQFIGWTLTSAGQDQDRYLLGFEDGAGRHKTIEILGGDFGWFGQTQAWDQCEDMRLWCFYKQGKPNNAGDTWVDIMGWDRKRLEQTHDFIQFICPNFEPSKPCPRAPVLTSAMVERFMVDDEVLVRAEESVDKMLDFYGINLWGWEEADFADQVCSGVQQDWIWPHNHNYRRLTRILKFCKALDLKWGLDGPPFAGLLLRALEAITAKWPDRVGTAIEFWRAANETA